MNQTYLRIDDRLVHGQVLFGWGKLWPADEIWLVDQAVAVDDRERALYEESIQHFCNGGVLFVDQAVELEPLAEGHRLFVVRDIATANLLHNRGVKIDQLSLGNVASAPGREQFAEHIHLSAEEQELLRQLSEDGVEVVLRDLPSDEPVDPFEARVKEGL